MTTPHAELKRLAERCTTGDPWYREGDLCGRQTFGQFLPQDRAFIAAANPQAILSLIEENERMRDGLEECREYLDRFSDVVDGDYGVPEPNEAMQLVHAIDQALQSKEGV